MKHAFDLILLVLFVQILSSCHNPLNKSIFKSLTVDELQPVVRKDTNFIALYKHIQYTKDSILKSDVDKAKWADLTYKRLYRFMKFSTDTNYFKPIEKRLKNEWAKKYGKYSAKVDSISKYWKEYKKNNSLNQYLSIELVSINKDYYEYIGGVKEVDLGFKLTPLKGPIEQVRFAYWIEPKLDEPLHTKYYYSSLVDKSWCLSTSPVSAPTIRYWKVNYTNENTLSGKNLETFNRDYNIYYEIDELRKDGKNIKTEDLKIPESVENHWKYENDSSEFMRSLYVSDIIRDVLKEKYLDEEEFKTQEYHKILKKKDSLSFNFLNLKYED